MKALRRLLPYYQPYRTQVAWGLVSVVASSTLVNGIPALLRRAIDALGNGAEARVVWKLAAAMVALILFNAVFRFWMREILNGVSRRIENDLRDITRQTPGLSYENTTFNTNVRFLPQVRFRGMSTNAPQPNSQVGAVFLDGIFIVGGETFVLLAALHRDGLLELIRSRVRAGMPFAGSSAGANVAGLVIGTTNDFPVAEIPSRTALGLVPVTVNPHHPLPSAAGDFGVRAGKIRSYLRFNPQDTVLGLGNTSMAAWRDGKLTLLAGFGWLYRAGGDRELKVGEPLELPRP